MCLSLSSKSCPKVQAQAKKHSDSKRLLTGKWPDSHHLSNKSAVKQKLDSAINVVDTGEQLFPPAAQKEKGSAIKRKVKEASPKVEIGSSIKKRMRLNSIDIE